MHVITATSRVTAETSEIPLVATMATEVEKLSTVSNTVLRSVASALSHIARLSNFEAEYERDQQVDSSVTLLSVPYKVMR